MTVTSYDPFLDPSEFPRGVAHVEDLPSLLAKADVVSVHIPLTDESRHLFNDETFRDMKPGAAFINTARGASSTMTHCSLRSNRPSDGCRDRRD